MVSTPIRDTNFPAFKSMATIDCLHSFHVPSASIVANASTGICTGQIGIINGTLSSSIITSHLEVICENKGKDNSTANDTMINLTSYRSLQKWKLNHRCANKVS